MQTSMLFFLHLYVCVLAFTYWEQSFWKSKNITLKARYSRSKSLECLPSKPKLVKIRHLSHLVSEQVYSGVSYQEDLTE